MLKHYFKIATRSILNDKGYSTVNLIGLSVAIACCFLLIFCVKFEMSYENCYPNANRIYRLMIEEERSDGKHFSAYVRPGFTLALKESFPQIEAATFISREALPFTEAGKEGSEAIMATHTEVSVDFLRMFAFEYVEGTPLSVIQNQGSIITEKMARKFFGRQSAIGQIVQFGKGGPGVSHTIEAVVKMPDNTDIRFDLLKPSERNGYGEHYIMLEKGQRMTPLLEDQLAEFLSTRQETKNKLRVQAIKDMRLHAPESVDSKAAERINQIYLFSFAAFLILIVAIINYVNTSIARALNRMKEVGVRKVTGAMRKQLIERFLFEAFVLSFISVLFAFLLTQLLFPHFSEMMGNKVSFGYDLQTIVIALAVCALVTILSGGYAAFYLSSLNPVNVLRGASKTGSKEMLRKALMGLQFFLSIAILICTLVIYKQIHAIFNAETGVDRKNILVLETSLWYGAEDFIQVITKENPNVLDATIASTPPYNAEFGYSNVSWEGSDEAIKEIEFHQIFCDHHYASTFGLELISGEFIPPGLTWWQHSKPESYNIVINESFQKLMGVDNPLGIVINYTWGMKGKIIGVVKDFNFKPLRTKITPLIISFNPEICESVFVKMSGVDKQATENYVLSKYKEMKPDIGGNRPVMYHTTDDDYNKMYETELRTAQMLSIFSIISFFLSLMGVISMISFMIEKRTKEVAIRKINGAGIGRIIRLFTRDIVRIALIASVIAIPLCYAVMHNWLQNYVYRTTLSWWIFLIVPLFILFSTGIIIAAQVFLTARKNPVDSLRNE
jgi:putative ABC transport system permease protein